MQIKEGVIHRLALVDNTLRDLHNSLYPTKAEFITHNPTVMCFPTWETHIPSDLSSFTWATDMPSVMCFPHPGNTYP